MKNFLDTIFFRSNNLDYISQSIKDLTQNTPAKKIFEAINNFSSESEIRYVGGCVRKIINKEKIDDIDLATNLKPGTSEITINLPNLLKKTYDHINMGIFLIPQNNGNIFFGDEIKINA